MKQFRFSHFILASFLFSLVHCSSLHAQLSADPLIVALSNRDGVSSIADLETIAGSKENLITRLLELRTLESPPSVGIRAEKILLMFADNPAVQEALIEDLQSPERLGLAQVITLNIAEVSEAAMRLKIAEEAVQRVQRQKEFMPYAKSLLESKDAQVSRLVRERLSSQN